MYIRTYIQTVHINTPFGEYLFNLMLSNGVELLNEALHHPDEHVSSLDTCTAIVGMNESVLI